MLDRLAFPLTGLIVVLPLVLVLVLILVSALVLVLVYLLILTDVKGPGARGCA